ncbi:hypothetical protein JDV02_000364 [Purpureocillium takamizusanense]|uniref:Asparaginase n=1 Tax=Purpureocillium takamizusanense TaxID=2060973 RepID=A0A9Q8V5E8_9HYPO|nr:uncharacterized protein JDV02_000364 [Purpureocillium takamizusanense]UNI13640.1 hypothetical protein JDV02_000364 [Purpureocillium takamizusanense]
MAVLTSSMAKPTTRPSASPTTAAHVVTTRNGIVENRHEIHACVVDASPAVQGNNPRPRLLLQLGSSPSRFTLVRSAAKPWQALVIVETGALERFGFDDADLALMCASHSSEERHVARARAMLLARRGNGNGNGDNGNGDNGNGNDGEADLRCGPHPALLRPRDELWMRSGHVPTPVWSNCSGKHAGVLAAAEVLGAGAEGYHELAHPVQQRVRAVTEELSGLRPDEVGWAVDGCNMASPAMPLTNLAHIYARFAQAADDVASSSSSTSSASSSSAFTSTSSSSPPPSETKRPAAAAAAAATALPSPRERHMARIFNAMTTHPDMVAGEDRFCTALMRAFGGRLFGKVGADGCYAIGLREGEETRRLGARGALGIAVKVEDGNMDVVYAAAAEILRQLGVGSDEERRALEPFRQKQLVNTAGLVTGGYEFPFEMQAN